MDYKRYIWKGATYSLPYTKHSLPNMEQYVLLKGKGALYLLTCADSRIDTMIFLPCKHFLHLFAFVGTFFWPFLVLFGHFLALFWSFLTLLSHQFAHFVAILLHFWHSLRSHHSQRDWLTKEDLWRKKNPAYGRHQHSRPMRIVGPIQI